jgi:signal peptidase II
MIPAPVSPVSTPVQPSPATAPVAVSLWARIHAYRWLWMLALGVFGLDQATKLWISAHLAFGTYDPPQAITVVDGFFYIVHVGNTGAAWSMLAGKSGLLAGMALFTLGAIYFWRHSLGLRQRAVQVSFGLLCGGIAGNLLDRVIHGHVIDFLDFHFGSYTYPTFNVADSGICVGVVLYLIYSLRQPAE